MSTMWTAVTLQTNDVLGQTFVVVVKRDQHGHVPTVLVNPIDTAGRRLPGVWLSEASHHTVYRRLPENPHSRSAVQFSFSASSAIPLMVDAATTPAVTVTGSPSCLHLASRRPTES
jgi:hypothetical protein